MKKQRVIRFSTMIAIVALPFGAVLAVGTQIQTDGSLPGAIPLNINAPPSNTVYPIQETNGKAAGNNLFYSFSQFNIGSGDTAQFNFTQNWNNVITRVTGGAASFIDGTLRVGGSRAVDGSTGATTLTNAAKSFFFINPSGITFGPGSVVDVPGSFYASTASTLNFSDGSSYRADNAQPGGLSAANPVSFGFLGNEIGALTLNQAKVQVFNDETLALVGRDINIDKSTVGMVDLTKNQPGRFTARRPLFIDGIQLLLLADHSQNNVPIDTTAIKALGNQLDGNINIKNTDLINAGGDAEEITFVRGGNIALENASVVSSNYGDDCGGFCGDFKGNEKISAASGIDILAKGALVLNNGHIVTETSFSPVNPIDNVAINVQANSLLMDNASTISSRSLNLANITPSFIPTGILPVFYPVNPKAGDININVNTDFVAKGGSSVTSSTETFGNAGEIKLTAGSITLDNANIKSESTSDTNGLTGYTNDGHNSIIVQNGRNQQDFYLDYNRFIPIQNQPNPYTNAVPPLQTTIYNAGDAGKVTLTANNGNINLANGSTVSTNIHSGTVNSGTAQINLISSSGAITVDNGSTISSTTSGDANAGDITVSAGGALQISNNSKITTDSQGLNGSKLGNSGIISVTSKDVNINNSSFISSSTSSAGSAGTVSINTNNLDIQGVSGIPVNQIGHYVAPNFTGIRSTANAGSSGQTGTINITAGNNVNLGNGAQVSISNQANVTNTRSLVPTSINISTANMTMNNSQVVADSGGNVNAGNININFPGSLTMKNVSAISTLANNGNGGHITINGGNMFWLQDSAITTSVLGLQGNGGDINLKSDFLIMDSGFIQANTAATGASGGNVNINVDTLIPSGSLLFVGGNTPFQFQPFSGINVIQAAAPNGIKGQINSTSPQLNLSGTLANLIVQTFDQNALSRDLCAIGTSSSLSQSGKGGLRRRARDALLSTY